MVTSVQAQPPSGKPRPLLYVPELDGLRALAAVGVLISHQGLFEGIPLLGKVGLRLGGLAVDMFLVLSGFLITGILIQCKMNCHQQPLSVTLRQFYIRRSLRIFPLYYLVFFAFAVVGIGGIRSNALWFLTYMVNFGKAASEAGFAPLNHFWTLAVEEQYYLCWPLIVLLLRLRSALALCIALGTVSVGFRFFAIQYGLSYQAIQQFTFGCFDPLCTGAAFAILLPNKRIVEPVTKFCLWVGVPASVYLLVFADQDLLFWASRLAYSMAFGACIAYLGSGGRSMVGPLLRWNPLVSLGRISYGVYVYHLPVIWLFGYLQAQLLSVPLSRPIDFVVVLSSTVFLSAVSWRLFERPLNDLKRYFPYDLTSDVRKHSAGLAAGG